MTEYTNDGDPSTLRDIDQIARSWDRLEEADLRLLADELVGLAFDLALAWKANGGSREDIAQTIGSPSYRLNLGQRLGWPGHDESVAE